MQAYGPDGLGALTVSGVPGYVELRKRLLPLAADFAVSLEVTDKTARNWGIWSNHKDTCRVGGTSSCCCYHLAMNWLSAWKALHPWLLMWDARSYLNYHAAAFRDHQLHSKGGDPCWSFFVCQWHDSSTCIRPAPIVIFIFPIAQQQQRPGGMYLHDLHDLPANQFVYCLIKEVRVRHLRMHSLVPS